MTDQTPTGELPLADKPTPVHLGSGWWTALMSGKDNETPAIGRVLGALLFLNLLMALPGVVVGVLLTQHEKWETWAALLSALVVYVPAVTLSVGGLIRGTAATEPKP